MVTKIKPTESRIKLDQSGESAAVRSGGEKRPLGYPHLYQIKAGDWRISYAVEHNRLAILVLEVLTPSGTAQKDPVRENLTKKLKVKLLDLPEELAPVEASTAAPGRKLKIKYLDLSDDADEARPAPGQEDKKVRIKLLDLSEDLADDDPESASGDAEELKPKVTPLDSPTL